MYTCVQISSSSFDNHDAELHTCDGWVGSGFDFDIHSFREQALG
jgi:hypothetical protein